MALYHIRAALLLAAVAAVLAAPVPKPNSANAALATFAAVHSKPGTQGLVVGGTQAGSVRKLGGLNTYVVTPNAKPTAAVIIFTDIYGWEFNNTRIWADRLARDTGYLTVVPDYFKGTAWKVGQSTTGMMQWLSGFKPAAVLKETDQLMADIRAAYPSVKKFGVQGFCWGGLYSVLTVGAKPRAAASIGYHASLVQQADIEAITAPILLENADPAIDTQIKPPQYAAFKKVLDAKKAKGLDASISYYPGMPHGFTLRGNRTDPATAKVMDTSFRKGAAFLKKYLS